MNRDQTYEQVVANMKANIRYLLSKGGISQSAVSTLSGVNKSILNRWAMDETYPGPSFKMIYYVVQTLNVNFNEFLYTRMEDKDNSASSSMILPESSDELLALRLFKALDGYEQDTVIRMLQCLVSSTQTSDRELRDAVIPEALEIKSTTTRTRASGKRVNRRQNQKI